LSEKAKKDEVVIRARSDQVGGSTDAVGVDHANTIDLCKDDKSKMPFEVGNNSDTPVCTQKVGETQSRALKNIVNHTGVIIKLLMLICTSYTP
jgi:hypothetical protein